MSTETDESSERNEIEVLVNQYRDGDKYAAEKLYALFSVQMLNLAKRIVLDRAGKSLIDFEGAVNSGFRSFFSLLGKPFFDSRRGQIGGLLATIVSRKVMVRLRRKHINKVSINEHDSVADFFLVPTTHDKSEVALSIELKSVLEPILDELTPKESEIVEALFDPFDDRSVPQLAVFFDTTNATIDQLVGIVQARLRQGLR